MRRVQRLTLNNTTVTYLRKQQIKVANAQPIDRNGIWKAARQTNAVQNVLSTLQNMMGTRARCMYCVDSHGSDIEHFRPKSGYPHLMFDWNNLLLCCTECGRIKGTKFPENNGLPLLIDPTIEEPWDFLDFDPQTGNVTARYDLKANSFSPKGEKTVETLQLDQREAMASGYLQTYRKLSQHVVNFISQPNQSAGTLVQQLSNEDEHGLLGWCFKGSGQNEEPFSSLKLKCQSVWNDCCQQFEFR